MKGDAFLEMAARCGDLPDSVMAVPGLEYVGEKSAEWEALCIKAAGWSGFPRASGYLDCNDLKAFKPDCYAHTLSDAEFEGGIRCLALFARLMAIVTREK
jgi:hypothetical protein